MEGFLEEVKPELSLKDKGSYQGERRESESTASEGRKLYRG